MEKFNTTKVNDIDVNNEQNDCFKNNVVAFGNESINFFELLFDILSIEDFEFNIFNYLSTNNDCKTITNHIYTTLSWN